MSARRIFQSHRLNCIWCAVMGAGFALALASHARGQDITPEEVENSKYHFAGVVNANSVFVRSGPSENDYATIKLDRGAEVKVVGIRFDWLKVVPPEGSFCYVAKAYVERRGSGNVGRVTNNLYVRVGSHLNELKAKVAMKLEPGADVEILGEEQEYFKIKPPAGVFFYINKQYVEPVRQIQLDAQGNEIAVPDPAERAQPVDEDETAQAPTDTSTDRASDPVAQSESEGAVPSDLTAPATQPGDSAVAHSGAAPATQPTADAEAEFERLEGQYAQASLQPIEEQPVAELLAGYEKLASSASLPESLRRIAEFKVSVLRTRAEAKEQLTQARQVQDDMTQKQMALRAEKEEIEQRVKQTEISFYTAVGTLRPSSLQQNAQTTLYRLTDPANGRTIVYLRTDDANLGGMIGQFIGVKGEVTQDSQVNMRIIAPTAYEPVNPAKVGQSVAAQIVPPSLLPGHANTNPNE